MRKGRGPGRSCRAARDPSPGLLYLISNWSLCVMTIDKSEFRNAMSRLGAAVNVITTDGPAGRHGLTASAVCSVTDTPPALLVCVNRTASAHSTLTGHGVLCVNVLSGRHQDLSGAFGNRGLGVAARFAVASWRLLATGAPVLAAASVSRDCRIGRTESTGRHPN